MGSTVCYKESNNWMMGKGYSELKVGNVQQSRMFPRALMHRLYYEPMKQRQNSDMNDLQNQIEVEIILLRIEIIFTLFFIFTGRD